METAESTPKEIVPLQIKAPSLAHMPKTLEEIEKIAKILASSDLAPKELRGKPADAAIAIMHGMELGLAPMQSVQSIMVVNGKPSIYGDHALAVVQASGKLKDFDEVYVNDYVDPVTGIHEGQAYVCTYWRHGKDKPIVQKFSQKDAEIAQLWKKAGPWTNYPRRMLQMRARGFTLRDGFSDILKGLITVEEVRDYVDTVTVPPEPRRASEAAAPAEPTPAQPVVDAAPPKPTEPTITKEERMAIFELCKKHKVKPEELKSFMVGKWQIDGTDKLPASKYRAVCRWIENPQEELPVA